MLLIIKHNEAIRIEERWEKPFWRQQEVTHLAFVAVSEGQQEDWRGHCHLQEPRGGLRAQQHARGCGGEAASGWWSPMMQQSGAGEGAAHESCHAHCHHPPLCLELSGRNPRRGSTWIHVCASAWPIISYYQTLPCFTAIISKGFIYIDMTFF